MIFFNVKTGDKKGKPTFFIILINPKQFFLDLFEVQKSWDFMITKNMNLQNGVRNGKYGPCPTSNPKQPGALTALSRQ